MAADIRCPGCQHENPDDAVFCERCGRYVRDFAGKLAAAEMGGAPPSLLSPEKGCARCGHSNVAAAVYCERCGSRLDTPRTEPLLRPRPARARRGPGGLIAAAAVLLCVLSAIGLIVSHWSRIVDNGGLPTASGKTKGTKTAPGTSFTPPGASGTPASGKPAAGWHDGKPMPTARWGHVAVAMGDTVFVIGGEGRDGATGANEAYGVSADQWLSAGTAMPTPRAWAVASAIANSIYVVGGIRRGTVADAVESYDPTTGRWTTRHKPIPAPCVGATAATLDGRLYVLGGMDAQGQQCVSTAWRYDPQQDSWTQLASMPSGRAYAAAVAVSGGVFVIGGSTPAGAASTIEYYDTASGTWQDAGNGPGGAVGLATVAGDLFIISNAPNSSHRVRGNLGDPANWKWDPVPDPPGSGRRGWAVAGAEGGVCVFGGQDAATGRYLGTVQVYTPG